MDETGWLRRRWLTWSGGLVLLLDLGRDLRGHRLMPNIGAGEGAGTMRERPQVDRIPRHLQLWHLGLDEGATSTDGFGTENPTAAGRQVAHDAADVFVGDQDRYLVDGLEQIDFARGRRIPERQGAGHLEGHIRGVNR